MESRKNEILKVAARLFREKGYSAVTMRDIAAALDIKAASLYNHISSKQEILQDIILGIAEDYTLGMTLIRSKSLNSIEQLAQIVHLHVNLAVQNPNGMSALNSDWMHLEKKRDAYIQMRDDYESNFRYIIKEGIKAGELKDMDINVVVFSMLTTLRSLYLLIPKKNLEELPSFSEDLADVLIRGINT